MNEDDVIIDDGEPIDPGDSSQTPPVDEETVPEIHDDGVRPDVDWDEDGIEGDADQQQTFTVQPVPPYRAGDMWQDGTTLRVCVNGKAEGESFAATDWATAEVVEPTPASTTKTITFTEAITDYSAESLASYQSRGAVAYALYDDGTRVQVPWSQVHAPEPSVPDTVADEALIIAEATNQHFWHRSTDPDADGAGTGAFVTDEEQETFLQAIAAGTEPTTSRPLHNLLMNAEGILLRAAKRVRAAFSPSGVAFYDGQGNAAANVVSAFGRDGAQIGASGQSHIEMDYHSLRLLDKENNTYFYVSDLRDESGKLEVMDIFHGDGTSTKFSLSLTPTSKNDGMDMADDYRLVVSDGSGGTASILPAMKRLTFSEPPTKDASITVIYKSDDVHAKAYTLGTRGSGRVGAMSVVAGDSCVATGAVSHAEGSETEASGRYSHAEGSETEASSSYSHAEGAKTRASGYSSHAEGYDAKANGSSSHAEGAKTRASGDYSHAEGQYSIASADYAHAQNRGAYAESESQTAIGRYNVRDADDTYALIIGNGTSDTARSNALTVGWDGSTQVYLKGIDSTAAKPGSDQTANVLEVMDASGVRIAQIRVGRDTDGNTGIAIVGQQGTSTTGGVKQNNLWVWVSPTGECSYYIPDPPNFRKAINAVGTSNQALQNATLASLGGKTQLWALRANVINSNNTAYHGHNTGLVVSSGQPSLYDFTAQENIWTAYTTKNSQPPEKWDVYKSTTVSQVITAESGRTVSSVTYAEWGKVAMLSVSISGWAASTGSQTGGTVVSGKRPVYSVYATDVSTSYAVYAQLTSSGALTVYWETAPSTSTSYTIRFIYILA